jgi:type VI secretion system protein ImpE
MNAEDFLREGRLEEAIATLTSALRDDPANTKQRTFLFELLCFAGEYDRAGKQLDILSSDSQEAMLGAVSYQAALNAERTRQDMFERKAFPARADKNGFESSVRGTLNGRPFESIADADPRIGSRLELFAAGDYLWMPFQDIAELRVEAPRRLRDLLWAPVKLRTGPAFRDRELGDILLPALCPLSAQHPDPAVQFGRVTEWCRDEAGDEAPFGQKALLVDGEEFPILEIRSLEIQARAAES